MARPFKEGLSYYPHIIGMYNDDKFLDIREKYGLLGLGIITKLLEMIYENGYFLKWSEKVERNFCLTNHIKKSIMKECIEFLTGICDTASVSQDQEYFFNRQIFKDNKILTSKSIQQFYISACTRRKKILIDRSCFLLSLSQETEEELKERLNDPKSRLKVSYKLLYVLQDNRKFFIEPIKQALIPYNEPLEDLKDSLKECQNSNNEEFMYDYVNKFEDELINVNINSTQCGLMQEKNDNNQQTKRSVPEYINQIETKPNRNQREREINYIPPFSLNPITINNPEEKIYFEIRKAWNEITGQSIYEIPQKVLFCIKKYTSRNITLEQFKFVIQSKFDEWKDDKKMCKQIRIDVILNEQRFEGYLNTCNKNIEIPIAERLKKLQDEEERENASTF